MIESKRPRAHYLRIGEALAAAHQRPLDRQRERHHVERVQQQNEQPGGNNAADEGAEKQHDEPAPAGRPHLRTRLRLLQHPQNWK